ncbi:MAG: hypothetical protein LUF85_11590 [Bacteroides sp.]|nr:hypothetical protein [Bacteroides sp.]
MYREIHSYVKSYIEANPSTRSRVLPYGKALWCYYPNNELVFDRFKINSYPEEILSVRRETLKLYMDLLEGDYSVDGIVAVCLYVFIKLLKLVEKDQIERAVTGIIDEISENINMYNSTVTVQELIDGLLESNDVLGEMYTYWEEDMEWMPTNMQEWLERIKGCMDRYGYPYTCATICDLLGLGKLHSMLIQMLIQMWYDKYRMIIK